MTKRAKVATRVPPEIVQRVAWYIPDEGSFFAFLEAFQHGSTDALGPLQTVWDARLTLPHVVFWPVLKLRDMDGHKWEAARKWKAALPMMHAYPTVELYAGDDLSMLVDAVGPSTTLVVRGPEKLDLRRVRRWFQHLADLPVIELIYTAFTGNGYPERMPKIIETFCGVLPSMQHLRRVELTVADPAMITTLVRSISKSSVVELFLRGPTQWHKDGGVDQTLNGEVLAEFVAWLTSKDVAAFALETYRFDCDDAVIQTLYNAIAASDSLTNLAWINCALPPAIPIALPRGLQKLRLAKHQHPQFVLDGLWKNLPRLKNLTHVDLTETSLTVPNVEAMAAALVGSSVCDLNLDTCYLGPNGCLALVPFLPHTRVSSLNLKDNCVGDEAAKALAVAFQATASLRSLNLWCNQLSASGLEAVLLAVVHRPYATKEVVLAANPGIDDVQKKFYAEIPQHVHIQVLTWEKPKPPCFSGNAST